MSPVDSETVQSWIEIAKERIALRQPLIDAGAASQATLESWSEWKMAYGRALFLKGEPLTQIRKAFRDAAGGFERVFQMSYDTSAPQYLGSKADPTTVTDVTAIEGLDSALIAGDPGLARRLALWIPPEPSDPSTPLELRCYTRGLQQFVLDEPGKAKGFLSQVLQKHNNTVPKRGYQRNYYTLALALSGIVDGSDATFNEGLRQQAEFYRGAARGENSDTAEEHICDHLVALGNLGLGHGREVAEKIPFLPAALLLSAVPQPH
ncbi:hypothetical protein POL68_32035 [Stigmatella sp. ncwal1]|uniref:Uncharacterized protein n=1 Tax=Stigmatella ashevillensis TaxID=2995309 RepID=A0ABT5DIZ8_9BACT|nr:hypothetical protein [Stigmatella ashevillena]MDC0713135.1 hypothetical protein [Stigmatella ashevillena]